MGDGSTPFYLNRITGTRVGTLNLGSATATSITSDEGGHLLIANHAENGQTFNIWTTSSVSDTPTLFMSFPNNSALPIGYEMKVIGDISTNATIIVTNEDISGVTSSSLFTCIQIIDGVVQTPEVVDISSSGLSWGASPVNSTNVVAASTDVNDGYFLSYYDPNILQYVDASGAIMASLANTSGNSWGLNQNNLDTKQFNNANYLALFLVSHFPSWGIGPELYVYDITDKSQLSGDVNTAPALVISNSSIGWYETAQYLTASGDVIISPSSDGYYLYIYYYDNNSAVIGGYVVDCFDD